jgi:hypothetical protein
MAARDVIISGTPPLRPVSADREFVPAELMAGQ